MNDKLLKNITYYGVDVEKRKLNEEVFELIEAITKYQIAEAENLESEFLNELLRWNLHRLKDYIIEEIADVQVLLNQFKLYYEISDEQIKNVMVEKIERQMERMEEEKCNN